VTPRYSEVEELTSAHNIESFDCGSDAQTAWFRRSALQSHQGNMNRVFVVRRLADDLVVGFYALATASVVQTDAPPRLTQGAGGYDIPVIVLTRLGVDVGEQGRSLGRALVIDALRRVDLISQHVGVRALLIHAENDEARGFYLHLAKFEQSPVDPLQLALIMKDLRHALAGPPPAT
jgi:GNAT superfamily N-acetyltransferase